MDRTQSEVELTKDTAGELWGIFWEDLGENWSCFNGTALYITTGADI